jgi:hypothetical protein
LPSLPAGSQVYQIIEVKAFDKSNAYNKIYAENNNNNTHCHFDESGSAG